MTSHAYLLTEHLDLWAAAVAPKSAAGRGSSHNLELYGLKKLRALILELAVRGQLVPQNPDDEPAAVLLNNIAAEKARLAKAGKIKKQGKLPPIPEDEKPFDLPNGWEWVRLGEIGETNIGLTYSPKEIADVGIPVLRSSNIQRGKIDLHDLVRVMKDNIKENVMVRESDLLICARNGSKALVGKTAMIKELQEPMAFGAFMAIYRSYCNHFIEVYLNSPIFRRNLEGVTTTTINQITQDNLKSTVIALPPLAEQHRIVAKVDELMALCDQLEQRQNASLSAHRVLVRALLAALAAAGDQGHLADAWGRIADHFDALFTTADSIDHLQQTILQLAVMGKLVPQHPDDEPAAALLNNIAAERARLVKAGAIKPQKPLPPIREEEKPFDLPKGWEWCRIGDASITTDYGLSEKSTAGLDGVPFLTMGHIQSGQVLLDGYKVVPPSVEGLPELYLENRDLLYNRTNSAELVGKTGIYIGNDNEYTFASYLIRIRTDKESLLPEFINMNMLSPKFRETQIIPHLKQQCGQANVNGTIMKNMLVAIPPSGEMERICIKVDELLALCDRLRARLAAARATQQQLADAVTAQAIG